MTVSSRTGPTASVLTSWKRPGAGAQDSKRAARSRVFILAVLALLFPASPNSWATTARTPPFQARTKSSVSCAPSTELQTSAFTQQESSDDT